MAKKRKAKAAVYGYVFNQRKKVSRAGVAQDLRQWRAASREGSSHLLSDNFLVAHAEAKQRVGSVRRRAADRGASVKKAWATRKKKYGASGGKRKSKSASRKRAR